jgi:hypothetical protein
MLIRVSGLRRKRRPWFAVGAHPSLMAETDILAGGLRGSQPFKNAAF